MADAPFFYANHITIEFDYYKLIISMAANMMSVSDINYEVLLGDCTELLETIPDSSIDCVLTDPPYFIDKLDNNWDAQFIAEDKCNSHIKHLPKGMKFSKEQSKRFYDFYMELSKTLFTKLKPGGYFLSFSSPRLYHAMAMAMDDAGFEIRDMINWVYTQSMAKGMSVSRSIDSLKITNEEKASLREQLATLKTPQIKSCFEPICVAMKPIEKTFLNNEMKHGVGLVDFSQCTGEGRVPANIVCTEPMAEDYDKNFLIKKPNKNEKGDYNNHVSVKPVELLTHLVKLFTRENAIVLDPFLGSGTTMLACVDAKRRCIGIEKNKAYYDIALKRLGEKNSA
jgi:site-specific DNA-methyltransferase (adenine-specific)